MQSVRVKIVGILLVVLVAIALGYAYIARREAITGRNQSELALIAAKARTTQVESNFELMASQAQNERLTIETREVALAAVSNKLATAKAQIADLQSKLETAEARLAAQAARDGEAAKAAEQERQQRAARAEAEARAQAEAQKQATLEQQTRTGETREIGAEVVQVLQDGVIVGNIYERTPGTRGPTYRYPDVSRVIIGHPRQNSLTEKKWINFLAYPAGRYTYTTVLGASRTVERWVCCGEGGTAGP